MPDPRRSYHEGFYILLDFVILLYFRIWHDILDNTFKDLIKYDLIDMSSKEVLGATFHRNKLGDFWCSLSQFFLYNLSLNQVWYIFVLHYRIRSWYFSLQFVQFHLICSGTSRWCEPLNNGVGRLRNLKCFFSLQEH